MLAINYNANSHDKFYALNASHIPLKSITIPRFFKAKALTISFVLLFFRSVIFFLVSYLPSLKLISAHLITLPQKNRSLNF